MHYLSLPTLVALLALAGCGNPPESTSGTDDPGPDGMESSAGLTDDNVETRTFRELVLEQQPAFLHDIMFDHGTMHALDWSRVPFLVYEKPDTSSSLLLSKPAGSSQVRTPETDFCSFDESTTTACQSFMQSSDPRDHPIVYSLDFTDIIRLPAENMMWYKVSMGDVTGWVNTPYAYDFNAPLVNAYAFSMSSHPFILWKPVDDAFTFQSTASDELANHPLASLMDSTELQLSLEPEIQWIDGEPFLTAHLSPPLAWEEFCMQTRQPVPEITGLVSMFTPDGEFPFEQVNLGLGYCD